MAVETQDTPASPAEWANRACETASRYYHSGRADEARQLCIAILERVPSHGRSLYLLALIALNSGDADLALGLAEAAIQQIPDVPFCYTLKGQILRRMDRFAEAAASLEEALARRPEEPVALAELAAVRAAQGTPEHAIPLFERSLARRPHQPAALAGLAGALREVRRAAEAIPLYDRAIGLAPASRDLRLHRALAYGETHRHEECASQLEGLLIENPDWAEARVHLARTYFEQKRYDRALEALQPLAGAGSSIPGAAALRAGVLFHLGRHREAVACHRLDPGQMMYWHYDPEVSPRQLLETHTAWHRSRAPLPLCRPGSRPRSGPIRIGYVSGDLCRHPAGWFLSPVVANHDRDNFEVYCYSTGAHQDSLTAEFRGRTVWRDAFLMNDDQLVDRIQQDGIDVLVDLSGFTAGNRLPVFARHPAPVQVAWIGYPGTTGLETMDYRLTDALADPPGDSEQFHTEKLYHLEPGFLCYGADPESPEPAVPSGPLTFGCFNHIAKLNDRVVERWARLLARIPESRLYLRTAALSCEATRDVIRERFSAAGAGPERLLLEGFDPGHSAHLAAYRNVDVALDPFPYNGTTTTYDALWMGVPVVALAGDRHAARMGASILHQAGHSEWLAATPEEYIEIAARLASAPRPAVRSRLLPPAMTDGAAFTRTLESAYRRMVDDSASGSSLARRVAAQPYWYHKIELPGGVVTPGWAPISRDAYRVPDDLTGLRVLDVGAWDGYWTFLALQRGAREVVAIDDFSDYLGSLKDSDRRAWENFDLCREALGYDESRCRRQEMSVYDASEERLGRFDVIFFFGTLYHLRHPLLVLDRLAALCDREIYVESAILDDFSPYRGGLGHGYPGEMVMEFYPDNQYGNNRTNWWVPSLQCLVHMVRAAGFSQVTGWKLTANPAGVPACRGFAKGIR